MNVFEIHIFLFSFCPPVIPLLLHRRITAAEVSFICREVSFPLHLTVQGRSVLVSLPKGVLPYPMYEHR